MKRLKIEMLTAVADVGNTYDIVTELSEYVTDVDAAIARESVRAVGRVALDGDQSVEGIVDRLLQFVDHGADYVTAETLIAIKDIVRKHPRYANECISAITGMEAEIIAEPAARAALVWLYGGWRRDPWAPYALSRSSSRSRRRRRGGQARAPHRRDEALLQASAGGARDARRGPSRGRRGCQP